MLVVEVEFASQLQGKPAKTVVIKTSVEFVIPEPLMLRFRK